jgi:hypothetical protein
MPRLPHLEVVAKDWLLRRDRSRADAIKNNATWLVCEHSSAIPFNCLLFLAGTIVRTCLND